MVGETGRLPRLLAALRPAPTAGRRCRGCPSPSAPAPAAAIDGKLYVIGGQTADRNDERAVYAFDPATGELERARAASGAALQPSRRSPSTERSTRSAASARARSSGRLRLRPGDRHLVGGAAAAGPQPRLRRGRLPGRDLDDRRAGAATRSSATSGSYNPRDRRVAARARDARSRWSLLGAAVAGDQIHAIWESTYQIYDASRDAGRGAPARSSPRHGLQGVLRRRPPLHRRRLHDPAPRQPGGRSDA